MQICTHAASPLPLCHCARDGLVAFLAPTELLAEQHFASVSAWLKGSGVDVTICTASHRRDVPSAGPRLVFGTHALMSGSVAMPGLGLVIVDEQHRFGVNQRMALVHKGDTPLAVNVCTVARSLESQLCDGELPVKIRYM